MKRKTAKEIIADSLLELAQKTNIEKITIQDIVDNCGYSPATFYRNFRDKYDVIAWYHAEQMGKIMENMGREDYTWADAYADSTKYYEENRTYLGNLFEHTSGLDSFVRNMTDINVEVYKKYMAENVPDLELDTEQMLRLRMYCLGASRLVSEWVLGEHDVTAGELAKVIGEAFPLPLS